MEPRICPECHRFLKANEELNLYLCISCWVVFTHDQTLPHPHIDKLCTFHMKKAEGGVHLVCYVCGKGLFHTNEEWEKEKGWFAPNFIKAQSEKKKRLERDIQDFLHKREEAHKKAATDDLAAALSLYVKASAG